LNVQIKALIHPTRCMLTYLSPSCQFRSTPNGSVCVILEQQRYQILGFLINNTVAVMSSLYLNFDVGLHI